MPNALVITAYLFINLTPVKPYYYPVLEFDIPFAAVTAAGIDDAGQVAETRILARFERSPGEYRYNQ